MRTLGLTILLALTLTACGGGSDDDKPSAGDDAAGSTPKCSEVWVEGQALPADYEGCLDDTGALVAAVSYDCKDGGELVGYDDKFWVVTPGGKIAAGDGDDPAYSAAFDKCKGLD